jgi:hypothetical protein
VVHPASAAEKRESRTVVFSSRRNYSPPERRLTFDRGCERLTMAFVKAVFLPFDVSFVLDFETFSDLFDPLV